MSDDGVAELDKTIAVPNLASRAEHFATEALLQPHEAFGRFITSLLPIEATPSEQIAGIQEASRIFNGVAPDDRKIILLYHFTDAEGAQNIVGQGLLGRTDIRTYLTAITPEVAQPLASAEDARGFETYFKEHKAPQTLREHMERFILSMKFKWKYDVQKRLLRKPIVPVGANKLENVAIVATRINSTALKRDEQGEIYVERPIQIQLDPDFQVFGPFPTPEKGAKK